MGYIPGNGLACRNHVKPGSYENVRKYPLLGPCTYLGNILGYFARFMYCLALQSQMVNGINV